MELLQTVVRVLALLKIGFTFLGEPLQPYTLEVYSIGSQIGFSLCKEGFYYYIGMTYGATYILWNQNCFFCTILTALCIMYIHIFLHRYPIYGGKYREHATSHFNYCTHLFYLNQTTFWLAIVKVSVIAPNFCLWVILFSVSNSVILFSLP
jgi:hypothetical protein